MQLFFTIDALKSENTYDSRSAGKLATLFIEKNLGHFNIHYCGQNLWSNLVHYKTIETTLLHGS